MASKPIAKQGPVQVSSGHMYQDALGSFFLRAGLAVVLLYASISAVLDPYSWVGFFPVWLRNTTQDNFLVIAHAVFSTALAVWLLSGRAVRMAATIMALWVITVLSLNFLQIGVVFRDVAIFFSALALIALHTPRR